MKVELHAFARAGQNIPGRATTEIYKDHTREMSYVICIVFDLMLLFSDILFIALAS